jgi:hypothetical protein
VTSTISQKMRTLTRVELAVDVGGKAVGDLADVRQAAGAALAAHLAHEQTVSVHVALASAGFRRSVSRSSSWQNSGNNVWCIAMKHPH